MQRLRKYPISVLVLLLLSNCSKQSEPDPLYLGNWLWEGSSGGIAVISSKPKANEKIVLTFEASNRFRISRNDTLLSSGTYQIGKANSIYSGKEESTIEVRQMTRNSDVKNTSPVIVEGIITQLTTDRLSISNNFYDGFGSSYVRVK